MTQSIGTTYLSTIATLSDKATIVEAFQYYHLGGLTGSVEENSIEKRLVDINARAGTIETNLGYGELPLPSPVNTRLTALEVATGGGTLSSTYLKMIPTSINPNLVTPATSSVVPMTIQGVVGQSANLQEWKTSATSVAYVDPIGKIYSSNGGAVAEVATISGTQTLTDKRYVVGINPRTASYLLQLTDQSKVVEVNSSSTTYVSIPGNANVAFPVGTYIVVLQTGTGQVIIDGQINVGWTVVINATPGLKARTQWSMITLIKRATNTWVVAGDLVA